MQGNSKQPEKRSPVSMAIKKFRVEVRNLSDAVTFGRGLLVQPDHRLWFYRSWVWDKLPRVSLETAFPGIGKVGITLLNAFSGQPVVSMNIEEIAVVAAVAKFRNARNVIEIGTFDGNTALNLAANTPPDAVITTVDLPEDWQGELKIKIPHNNYAAAADRASAGGVGARFRGTEYEPKIRQVLADSAVLNWAALSSRGFDFIVIDGCHFYDYVKKDTENAFRHLLPRGVVVWHDYGNIRDVCDLVEEVAKTRKVYAISGTRLALAIMD